MDFLMVNHIGLYMNNVRHHRFQIQKYPRACSRALRRLHSVGGGAPVNFPPVKRICKSMYKVGLCSTHYARIDTSDARHAVLNFPNLCDNFVQKLVSEMSSASGGLHPPDHWGLRPQTPILQLGLQFAEGLDTPLI